MSAASAALPGSKDDRQSWLADTISLRIARLTKVSRSPFVAQKRRSTGYPPARWDQGLIPLSQEGWPASPHVDQCTCERNDCQAPGCDLASRLILLPS